MNLKTADWDLAALKARDLDREFSRVAHDTSLSKTTLAEVSYDFLTSGIADKAASTRKSYASILTPEGPLMKDFGRLPLDDINPSTLNQWWGRNITNCPTRGVATGRRHLDVLSRVFVFAGHAGLFGCDSFGVPYLHNPVEKFRKVILAPRLRGKASQAGAKGPNPVEDPSALARLIRVAREAKRRRAGGKELPERDLHSGVAVLLMVDAGLRLGEVGALRWEQVKFGASSDDPSRALVINRALSAGVEERPKSGRERTVPMSRRLRGALQELSLSRGFPSPNHRVFPDMQWNNWRARVLRRLMREADAGTGTLYDAEKKAARFSPHDLRDTFASWLLSLGVSVAEVAYYLGHRETSTTERSYARWVRGAWRVRPPELGPTDVTTDLLAAVGAAPARSRSRRG